MRRNPHPPARAPRRGISLIEALVAMAVMAFGMLGVVGLQATLRANADLSKQRTEGTRIAQERIEQWRNFSAVDTIAGRRAFADMATFTAVNVVGYTTNTTYSVSGTVAPPSAAAHKTLKVSVSWTDRANTLQTVTLISGMAQIAPEFGATAVAPPGGLLGVRNPGGRARGIPPQAKNFGDGTSGFRPPQTTGNVAWLFNNATGVITSICTTTVTDNNLLVSTDLVSCVSTTPHLPISGYIRFLTGAVPTPTNILNPTGSTVDPITIEAEVDQTAPGSLVGVRACFHALAATHVQYFCAVPVEVPNLPITAGLRWSGALRIKPASLPALSGTLADLAAANRKVCRYRAAAAYAVVTTPLANENLAVISAGNGTTAFTCPGPDPTWAHQPAT